MGPEHAMEAAVGAVLADVEDVQAKVQAELDRAAARRASNDGFDRMDSLPGGR